MIIYWEIKQVKAILGTCTLKNPPNQNLQKMIDEKQIKCD